MDLCGGSERGDPLFFFKQWRNIDPSGLATHGSDERCPCHPERLVTQGTGCIGQTTEAWPWGSEQHGKGAVLFQGAREALAEEVRGGGLESRAI